jgi:uncharacterized protein (TIGR03435 family)
MIARTLRTAAVIVAATALLGAQSPTEFEVISIKPASGPPDQAAAIGLHVSGSQVRINDMSIKDYITYAYNVRPQQIVGPDWIAQQRFEFAAKLPDGSSSADVPAMMRAMLASRFEMKMHHEDKEFPVYALNVAKAGLKLKEAAPTDAPAAAGTQNIVAGGSPNGVAIDLGGGSSFTLVPNHLEIRQVTLDALARTLTRFTDRPVINRTGVPGTFDLTIELSPEEYTATLIRSGYNAGIVLPPQALRLLDVSTSNPLTGGLEKFGLSLDPVRAPLDVVVVDSVKHTPNEN